MNKITFMKKKKIESEKVIKYYETGLQTKLFLIKMPKTITYEN